MPVRKSPLWAKLIWTVMFLVVLEGAIRKWLLPGFQAQIYFVKDAVLLAAYGAFLFSPASRNVPIKAMAPLKIMVGLSMAYFGLELLNPNTPSFMISLVGLKYYVLYMPLAFVVPYLFESADDLEQKLRKYSFLMLPCIALGLVQFAFPPDHWLNGFLNQDSDDLRMGELFGGEVVRVRTMGTFSYLGGYTEFLTVMFYLIAALAAKKHFRVFTRENIALPFLLIVTMAAMFTTGSRTPVWGLVATWPLVLCIWMYCRLITSADVGKMLMLIVLVAVAAQFVASDAYDAYASRSEQAADTFGRLMSPLTETVGALEVMEPFGTGMATTGGGALSIMGTREFWWLGGNFFEIESARVVQETGIIGFILIYSARLWLFIKAISLGVRFRTPLFVALSGVLAGLFFQHITNFVINNATVGIYHWFAAGLLFGMVRIETQMRVAPNRERSSRIASPERSPASIVDVSDHVSAQKY